MLGALTQNDVEIASSNYCPALEYYARTMLAYTQFQMRSLPGLNEIFGASNSGRGSDPATAVLRYHSPNPPNCPTLEYYTRTMFAYTQFQIQSIPGLNEILGTNNSGCGGDPVSSLPHYQDPCPPSTATNQEAGRENAKRRRFH